MKKVKICVPITGSDREEVLQQAEMIAKTDADLVEWRADYCPELLVKTELWETLAMLREKLGGKELLFTIRTIGQGGRMLYTPGEYEAAIMEAMAGGCLTYVDVEAQTEPESRARLLAAAAERGVLSIVSHHDFQHTPELDELYRIFDDLAATGADILKTAYMPESPSDVARLMYATAEYRKQDREQHELITMSMGELGKISRAAAGVFGSAVSFAAVCEASAPGQMPLKLLRSCLEVFA